MGDPCDADIEAAWNALTALQAALGSGQYDVVIADEANVAFGCRLISEQDLLELIKRRPHNTELILTGRNAPDGVIERADLVTEMREVKHYYQKGVMAREGIEK
jgi:cob(I)alamin adenosyltransferase